MMMRRRRRKKIRTNPQCWSCRSGTGTSWTTTSWEGWVLEIFPPHVVWTKHCSLPIAVKKKRAADPSKEPEKRSPRPSVLLRLYIRLIGLPPFSPVSFRLTINGGPLGTGRKGREKRGETVLLFSSSLSCCGGWPRTRPPVSLWGIHCGNSDEEKKSLSSDKSPRKRTHTCLPPSLRKHWWCRHRRHLLSVLLIISRSASPLETSWIWRRGRSHTPGCV